MAPLFDPFEALGVERDATQKSIRARYIDLSKRYHPSRVQTRGPLADKPELSSHYFHQISQAWQLLSRPGKRRRYAELLDLEDLHKTLVVGNAQFFSVAHELDKQGTSGAASADGHTSSDADDADDDVPRVPGIRKRQTFDKSFNRRRSNSFYGDAQGEGRFGLARSDSRRGRQGESLSASFRRVASIKSAKNGHEPDIAGKRRRQLEDLRRKELDAFDHYSVAFLEKYEAEERAEMCWEKYEQAKWRREYLERVPKDKTTLLAMVRSVNKATQAFSEKPGSYGPQLQTNCETFASGRHLALPSRTKSFHGRAWSSDISGDQESSDEEEVSSERPVSPSKCPPPVSIRERWEAVPDIVPASPSHPMPSDMSLIRGPGPGPKVSVRPPTNMQDVFDGQVSDADSATASSRSASPHPPAHDSTSFIVVCRKRAHDMLGGVGPRSRSRSAECRSVAAVSTTMGQAADGFFQIKQVGHLQHDCVLKQHVHELTWEEKCWALRVEADGGNPERLLADLDRLDPIVRGRFSVKADVKSMFNFRLVYGHRHVVKNPEHSFIALSYRRKRLVEKFDDHYSLPIEPEMFRAVWDERMGEDEGLWIDQICIDQDSDSEKATSMSAMDMVYRSARLVVVALDDVELDASETMIMKRHMDEYNEQSHVPATKRFRRKHTPYLQSHPGMYKVVQKLLRSSWFRRAWCRHEMRLAKEHVFLVPCQLAVGPSPKSVIRLTGKCLTHILALATEVALEPEIESVKPALYAFFRDRSNHLRSRQGNFTTVVAEVFDMEAGGNPRIPSERREADARKDKISIILNTMECGLALRPSVRDVSIPLSAGECQYMLLLLALAARDPGALCSVGKPMRDSWLFEPTNVDSGLNNSRALAPMPHLPITNRSHDGEHSVQLSLTFGHCNVSRGTDHVEAHALAEHFMRVCQRRRFGRHRHRYLITERVANKHFGSMEAVYVETLACVFACGPDWLEDVCARYGVARWKHDLEPAFELMVALKNTCGRWPEHAWGAQAAGFIMDFANFLVIRGMPQRQITALEEWRPICTERCVHGVEARAITFVPPANDIHVAMPTALLDEDYIHLARLWVLQPRDGAPNRWTLLGKSVLFSDDAATNAPIQETDIREKQIVYGRGGK